MYIKEIISLIEDYAPLNFRQVSIIPDYFAGPGTGI